MKGVLKMSDLGNKKIMAENISHFMELTGKSRNDLCKDLNLAYTTVSDWINGKTYPRIDKIELLANYFGVEKADLVEKQHLLHNSDKKTLELINLHINGILHWSSEIGITKSQTIIIHEHLDNLLLKYKALIERFSESNLRWKDDKNLFTSFLKQRNENITDMEVRKAYLEQELSDLLHEISDLIISFPYNMANNEILQETNTLSLNSEYIIPNAAHDKENVSYETKQTEELKIQEKMQEEIAKRKDMMSDTE